MNNFRRIFAAMLVFVLVFGMVGCSGDSGAETTAPTGNVGGEQANYGVTVKSKGGMPLADVDVYVYSDSTLGDLKQYGQTNENGEISFSMPLSSDYNVVVSGVAEGYQVAESYTFTGNNAAISLASAPVAGESLAGATLGVGDVMYDFSVVTPGGETVTLSEMLKEKEMVLLNFWYTTCTYCVAEFPYMEEAYQQYIDNVGIIAVNPFEEDAAIAAFQAEMGLTFPMAKCQPSWTAAFGISGYPTSVIIDRYGVICLVEAGGITSLRPFISLFDHFTGDDYEQKLFPEGLSTLVTNVKPTFTMDSSETIAEAINGGEIQVAYRPETEGEDAEYAWPFIITEKNGETCLKASNQQIDDSYAILYADVTLEAGQALAFDYLASSERAADVMHVIVNDEPIYTISGVTEGEETWTACYPWVAEKAGTYELALCYIKDESNNQGDDTVYIKDMRIVDADAIDVATYIPRYVASTEDGFEYSYVDVILNEKDGYYHVGTADGPLLLADLMGYTQFSEEQTLWDICYEGPAKQYYEELVNYFNYASNSSLNGVCTVNGELAELLKKVVEVAGFEGTDTEWLKICKYYQVYGSDVQQLTDPIEGLATFSAPEAKLGKNVETNCFYYDRIIMPRGKIAKFVPNRSGVYRITSRHESNNGVEGWIFDENREEIYTYEQSERMYNDSQNVSMLFYMEAGKPYFIDIAFWDYYEVGYIYYDIEYVGATYNLFRLASPGYFTYDTDATGEAMYYTIAGGVDVVLGEDGKYYEDLGKDANGKQLYGSLLYADFTGITALFDTPIATVDAYDENGKVKVDENGEIVKILGMIDKGGFDFSKTEEDLYIKAFLDARNGDVEATDEYLRAMWGEDYDTYAEAYQVKDVYQGIYHGTGEDLTEEMRGYLNQIITSGNKERIGCVVVDERLAEILQMLMDKYTFKNVEHSWTKLCYYYETLGPKG